jgi:rhomboid protease GluP
MNDYSDFDEPPSSHYLPLPTSSPFVTYMLLGAIAIIFVLMEFAGGSQNVKVLVAFGANYGPRILEGETWRLFTSMFLHVGLVHLAFNGYALFGFGVAMERLYGPDRFVVIYILAGLFGSLASFAGRGPNVLSAGASGAIFGVIGMNLAFFLLHRHTFGEVGRQQLMNTLVIIGINLFLGFTATGIDNLAHMGGLGAGFALGYVLAPRYELVGQYTLTPHLVDRVSLLNRWWAPALAVLLLAGGVPLAIFFWLRQL